MEKNQPPRGRRVKKTEITTTKPFSMKTGQIITISGASNFKLNLWGKIKQFLMFWRDKKGSKTYNGTYRINLVNGTTFVYDKYLEESPIKGIGNGL